MAITNTARCRPVRTSTGSRPGSGGSEPLKDPLSCGLQDTLVDPLVLTSTQPCGPQARTPQQVDTLIDQVLMAISANETRHVPVESKMETSSGTRASYRSRVQATAPWAIDALRRATPLLRKRFGLDIKDLITAMLQAKNAGKLYDAVMASDTDSTDTLIADNQASFKASKLGRRDLEKMILMKEFRALVEEKLSEAMAATEDELPEQTWEKADRRDRVASRVGTLQAVKNSPSRHERLRRYTTARTIAPGVARAEVSKTLRIGVASIRAYAQKKRWAEDRIAWQRVSVEKDIRVGKAIKTAAEDDGGLTLALTHLGRSVRAYLKSQPTATDEQVCRHVAGLHNPGSDTYVGDVLEHFRGMVRARRDRVPHQQ